MLDTPDINIYLVDNEPLVTKTFQEFIKNLGYRVVSLNSVHDLLYNLEKSHTSIRLVIMDIGIFRGQDVAIIREVRRRYADIYFLIIISGPPILSTEEAISYGVYGYLHKPIYLAELELLLLRIIKKYKN